MNCEYVGMGLGVLAIGITLVIGVSPPWWPGMLLDLGCCQYRRVLYIGAWRSINEQDISC
jgi:hypothetical protein